MSNWVITKCKRCGNDLKFVEEGYQNNKLGRYVEEYTAHCINPDCDLEGRTIFSTDTEEEAFPND